MFIGKQKPKSAEDIETSLCEQTRISLAPKWTWRLIICGALLDVVSTFLPWGGNQLYLPGSLIIRGGTPLPASEFLTISLLIRVAAVAGWVGVLLHEYVKIPILHYATILTSSLLSLLAVALFAIAGIDLSWGAYLGLVGGVFLASGIVIEKLEMELVVNLEEEHERKTEDDSIDGP